MHPLSTAVLIFSLCGGDDGEQPRIEADGRVTLAGDLAYPSQLSGLAVYRGMLVACPDEGTALNVLAPAGHDRYQALSVVSLSEGDAEIDMEGLTCDGDALFVIGSHSRARKKIEETRSYQRNRERLEEIKDERSRHCIVRFELDRRGHCSRRDQVSLRKILKKDAILGAFTALPSKENGIDIEGIAAVDGKLYLGFRGPVLRGNYVPVMVLRYNAPAQYELMFLNLGGRGIRDLTAYAGGLLVLAGPVGDGVGSYELYCWNCQDCLPGRGGPQGRIRHIGTLESPGNAKPEGMAVVEERANELTLLLVSDGIEAPVAERVRVRLPR
ncbi:MAG: DUF3616 domain-containing protein [Planctomycetota bacterium]|nr:MAG: DUF3616 domain-containing protein [Planctomycetota bacterium]